MLVTTEECCTLELVELVDVVDLGDAATTTKQIWFGTLPDSEFGLGFFRD
jgi:hypothetical protein